MDMKEYQALKRRVNAYGPINGEIILAEKLELIFADTHLVPERFARSTEQYARAERHAKEDVATSIAHKLLDEGYIYFHKEPTEMHIVLTGTLAVVRPEKVDKPK